MFVLNDNKLKQELPLKVLRAWRVNEYEWYAAYSFYEAVKLSMYMTGCDYEECIDEMFAGECSLDNYVFLDDELKEKTTMGAIISEMKEPGFLCGME